mmetsp:Transcript_51573/g.128359  ORF Transcript_51573/g.128359 Transcript_51573/m.128359 type:complete len:151 (+) Transcript_51573:57-509(+)
MQRTRCVALVAVWAMAVASVQASPARSSTPTLAAPDHEVRGIGAERAESVLKSVLEVRQMELEIEVNKRLAAQQAMFEVVGEDCGAQVEEEGSKFSDVLHQPQELSSLMREMEGARRDEIAVERALLREREYNMALAARMGFLEHQYGFS